MDAARVGRSRANADHLSPPQIAKLLDPTSNLSLLVSCQPPLVLLNHCRFGSRARPFPAPDQSFPIRKRHVALGDRTVSSRCAILRQGAHCCVPICAVAIPSR
jgi:hypothetical protein